MSRAQPPRPASGVPADPRALRDRVAAHVREQQLLAPGEAVAVLVSGGADSTCLWHVLRALGHPVTAVHVDHHLRGAESAADARHCREALGAEVVDAPPAATEAELRDLRYGLTARFGLRATGHTASDQVETVLYRIASSGVARGIKALREDGVVRPLLPLWREETEAYCRAEGLATRTDSTNPDTLRGLIRAELLPLLRRLHPSADANVLALAEGPPALPVPVQRAFAELLGLPPGSARVDLGSGLVAAREYDRIWLERGPVPLEGCVRWGRWVVESDLPGLHVRGWRAGDRLAGRSKKVQDVFVDAKVPRSEREAWPLVVRGGEVLAVPGLVEAPGIRASLSGEGA